MTTRPTADATERARDERVQVGPPVLARALRRDARSVLEGLRSSADDLVPVAGTDAYLVVAPRLAAAVLADGDRFEKASGARRLRYAVGDGTATSRLPATRDALPPFDDLAAWRTHKRAVLQPAFNRVDVEARATVATSVVDRRSSGWRDGVEVDLVAEARAIAVESFVRSFQPGADIDAHLRVADRVAATRHAVDRAVRGRVRSSLDRDYRSTTRAWQFAAAAVDPVTRAVRARRLALERLVLPLLDATRRDQNLLFAGLAEAAAREGEALEPRDLLSSAVSLYLAGWENTATALTWTLWCLAEASDEQERVAADGDQRRVVRAAVNEALRLYPPVWSIPREARRDVAFDGVDLPAGTTLVVSPWVLHGHEALWDAPGEFRPSRFDQPVAPGAFVPFGLGPRLCQGRSFAVTEVEHVVSSVVRRWRLTPVGDGPEPVLGSVQFPAGRAVVRLERRPA